MNWWSKSKSSVGQIMTINRLIDINYKTLKDYFGKPHSTKTFSNDGRVYEAVWRINFFGTPYNIELSADDAAQEHWRENKYTVPSVEHEIVDFASVIGDRDLYEEIIRPLLKMVIKKDYNGTAAKNSIRYAFEEMKK